MLDKIILSNEELYYIGKRTGGSHLNYSYIAEMEDISQRRAMIQEKIKDALVEKGYATENLWGETTVKAEVVNFLHPVFNGDREAVVEIEDNAGGQEKAMYLFHMDEVSLIIMKKEDEMLIFQKMEENALEEFITSLIPWKYNEINIFPEKRKVSAPERTIVGQYLEFGKSAAIRTIKIIEGQMYYLDEDNKMHPLDQKGFYREIHDLITGGNTSGIS